MHFNKFNCIDRRQFVKSTALGMGALGLGPAFFFPRPVEPEKFEPGFRFHPHMDPLRIVGMIDPKMISEVKETAPWRVQDRLVQADRVDENIDLLACELAQEKRPQDAWKKLFIKPPGKAWNETTVAIKTNNIGRQHTRSAVLSKICRVLTDLIGVKPSSIFIYDACHGADMAEKTPFEGLPEGCNVSGIWGGFAKETAVGKPWLDGNMKVNCLEPLVTGEIDLLINIALCKGHSPSYGAFTMSMKNHMGTFNPRPHAHENGKTDFLFAINRSPLVLGDLDFKTGKVLYPKQQLCLIDALWASEQGPICDSSAQPCRLYMGIFSPVLDYLVARDFRSKIMGWRNHDPVLERFLTDFGFSADDLPENGAVLIDRSEKEKEKVKEPV
ncbi:MAG: DUF362 domain-containing protein [Planctomycetes bacterium]|nr:DUF362 domain-containing protein [Planctomycetota bacterium]